MDVTTPDTAGEGGEHPGGACADHEDTVVLGYDATPASRAAVRAAVQLVRRLGARLLVVHVVDLRDYPIDPDGADWESGRDETLQDQREALSIVLDETGVSWSYVAQHGAPADALSRAADDADAAYLVVGAHASQSRLLAFLLRPSVPGSLARGHRPVLVVPADEHSDTQGGPQR